VLLVDRVVKTPCLFVGNGACRLSHGGYDLRCDGGLADSLNALHAPYYVTFEEPELTFMWVRTLLYMLSRHYSLNRITKLDTFMKATYFKNRLNPYTRVYIIYRIMFRTNMKYEDLTTTTGSLCQ
jgi:hypothetical protein